MSRTGGPRGSRLADLVAGRRSYRLMAFKGTEPAALLSIEASLRRQMHSLKLLIHPKHRGQLEPMLVSRALSMLAGLRARGCRRRCSPITAVRSRRWGSMVSGKADLLTMSYRLAKRGAGDE